MAQHNGRGDLPIGLAMGLGRLGRITALRHTRGRKASYLAR